MGSSGEVVGGFRGIFREVAMGFEDHGTPRERGRCCSNKGLAGSVCGLVDPGAWPQGAAGAEDGQRGRRQEPGQEAGGLEESDGEPGQVRSACPAWVGVSPCSCLAPPPAVWIHGVQGRPGVLW